MRIRAYRYASESRGFGWRDIFAFAAALFGRALGRAPHLSPAAIARISALDVRQLPMRKVFTTSDGEWLSYRSYEADCALHLVMIHGSACFGDQLHQLANHLAARGIANVHTVDMRGHGHSAREPDDYARYASDVIEFSEGLAAQNPANIIVVGGHSAGGGLAINCQRLLGAERFAGWLLFAPYLTIPNHSVRRYLGGWINRFYHWRFAAVALANLLGITGYNHLPLVRFSRDACLHDPRFVREWSFNAIFGFGPGPVRRAGEVIADVPVLLVAGENDECFHADRYPRALRPIAPAGECHILPGLGHWDVLVDDAAMQVVSQWLEDHFADAIAAPGQPAPDEQAVDQPAAVAPVARTA